MSDLFTRLAQRALADSGPTIRAPAESDSGPLVGEDAWAESTDLSEPSGSTVPTVPTVPTRETVTGPPAAERAPERPARDGAGPAAAPAPGHPTVQVATDGTAGTRTARLVPAPSTMWPGRGRDSSREAVPPAGEASDGTAGPVPGTDHPGSIGADRNGRHGPPPDPAPLTRSVLRPPMSPAPPDIASTRDRTAPPIEVTVGRLEIRVRSTVTAGGSGSSRRGEPAPALSLEEYLRRREGAP